MLTFLVILVLTLGAVSAADVNSTSDVANDVSTVTETGSSYNDVSINVKVDYQYSDDSKVVEPDFYVYADGDKSDFVKTYDETTGNFILTTTESSDNNYNITAMTAGYTSSSQIINSIDDTVTFTLNATDAYKLGRDVTISADKELNFKTADDVLVVTSAGIPRYNGDTSEDAIEAIVNYGNIEYSNVLMLRETANDTIDFAFIVKRGNNLQVAVYENTSTKASYVGTISQNMTRSQWNTFYKALSGENAYAFSSLANAWAAGVSREILQEAAFHGHVCEGTLGGYSIIKALLQYYPPVQETSVHGEAIAGDVTSYKVLGVPGGSDDDAALFFLDATVGKSGYIGLDTTATGATENMIGFIRWYSKSNTGDLIVMTYDSNQTKASFQKETGINPDAGTLEELKYNTWWINKINTNPASLVTFLYEYTNVTPEQYYYLMGTASNVTITDENEDQFIQAEDAHGLDIQYIKSLKLPKATRATDAQNVGKLTDQQIKQIGIDAANRAIDIYKEELGIDITKDMVNFGVLTSAGYVFLENEDTVIARDGLREVLGASISSKNLLPLHNALWKPLWFAFMLREPGNDDVYAAYLRYNPDGTFYEGYLNDSKVINIGRSTLNDSAKLAEIEKTFIPDGNWFNIQTEINAWKDDPAFDQMITFLYHAHVCPGVQPGFFITDYIQSEYPLSENESYTYIASSIYCKDDSLTYLLGISPGLGTMVVQRLTNEETTSDEIDGGTDEGALVVWDKEHNIGRVSIITFKWPVIDTSMYSTSEGKRATQIAAMIDLYKGNINENVKEGPQITSTEDKWITQEQFNQIKSGSDYTDTLSYIRDLPTVTKEELLKAMGQNDNTDNTNSNTNTDNDTNTNTNTNTHTNTNTNTNAHTSSHNNNRATASNTARTSSNGASVAAGTTVAATAAISSETNEGEPNEAAKEEASEEPSADAGSSNAYEITQKESGNTDDSRNILYYIGGLVLVGGLAGYGFMRFRKN